MHALVIEDNDMLRRTIGSTFETFGYSCVTARSGSEALRAARDQWPDLVVLDLGLPAPLSGWQTLDALRELSEDRELRVAVLTGNSVGAREAQGRGVCAYLKGLPVRQVVRQVIRHFQL